MSEINQRPQVSPFYMEKIQSMHDEKIRINQKKLARYGGSYNTDDHGFICFDGFTFTPEYLPGKTRLEGAKNIGENLRRFFRELPVYIYKDSALAGAWAGRFQEFANVGMDHTDVPEHLRQIHEKYHMLNSGIGGMNHMGPDMAIGLREGFVGILNKIRYYRDFNNPVDTGFYDGEEAVVLGMLEYTENHANYAAQLAEAEEDPFRKENYLAIERACRNLLTAAPANFREACQLLAVFQSADRTYFLGGALGQLDELLRPFYERDVKAGILTDEQAVWILASLFYNDTHYSQVGGQLPDGSRDLSSRMSYLILEAAHLLRIPYNLAIRVYEGMDERLLHRALEHILEAGSGVAFSCAKGIEEGYTRQGHPRELARMRAKVGCNWVALPGIEYPLQDVTRVNMAWAFVIALDEVMTDSEPSLEKLWDLFASHLKVMVDTIKEGYDYHYENISKIAPEIILNLFSHGPVERGLNAAEGGVDIINLNIDGIALATIADSLAAIEQRVVKEKRITWQEMYTAVKNNYEGAENIRLMLKNIPRFGSPDSLAKNWAKRISVLYTDLVTCAPTPKHHLKLVPGLFSHGDIYRHGADLPATPNGRKAGEAISHSAEPDPGFAVGLTSFSPTLKANAVALVQPGFGNSAPLHLDVDADMVKNHGGIETLAALIKTHNEMGGTLINLNCITKDQIRRAHADPASEPDLVVRVTGYSAFFASLSREYRQQVVDRYLSDER